ncbi:hypothetical protein U1Q18_010285 [Sarracenia purpurea var. burkii]
MWTTSKNFQSRGFSTPPPPNGKSRGWSTGSPVRPFSDKKRTSPQPKSHLFHVIHKVPAGDSPYVRAKHVQLIEKDPSRAISLFWAAINSGDRVDSALKDMAVVMKQLNRSDEAIEAIKSFRHLCPLESQESLDNVLIELYKRSGRFEQQIEMLQQKVKNIEEGIVFGGKRTKSARSQGKKVQITIEQEYSRLLGNLAWAYMQQNNFESAEELYRKALCFEQDKNKQCNLAICLMHMKRISEAKLLLQAIQVSPVDRLSDDSYVKSFERATQTLVEFESKSRERTIVEEEEQSHKEIRMPFTSLANKNLEDLSSLKYEGQNYVSGSCFQCQHEDKNNFSDSDRGCSKYISFELQNCSEPSSRTSLESTLKKGSCGENLYDKTADSGSKSSDRWVSNCGIKKGSFYKISYASPAPDKGIPKVPFLQPSKYSWSSGNGDQRRAFQENGVVGVCSRKLSFHQPRTRESYDEQLPASTNETSKAASQEPESGSPCVGGDRKSSVYLAEVNDESGLQPVVNRELGGNSRGNDGQLNLEIKQRDIPMESLAGEAITSEEFYQSSNICTARTVRMTEIFENNCFIKKDSGKSNDNHEPIADILNPTQELLSQSHSVAGNLEDSRSISACKSKKSWADMVEEEEQLLLSERTHHPESTWVYPSQESSISFQTPSRSSGEWNNEEDFDDENMNSNIISQTVTPHPQIDRLKQKIESFDLKDGYYTQPENANLSINRTVRRFLCFDQHQKPGRTDNYCSSPMPNVGLNFEGTNSLLVNKMECSSGNGTQLLRNRLQVFKDITLSSGSPQH